MHVDAGDQFEVESITGAVVDLIGDGKRTPVTPDNAQQYFDMALAFRLSEFDRHVSLHNCSGNRSRRWCGCLNDL